MFTGTNIRRNQKKYLVILRALSIIVLIGMMVTAPSSIEAKLDDVKKITNNNVKENNIKSSKNNSIKFLPIELDTNDESNMKQNCNKEKPCFLNYIIKYNNIILQKVNILNIKNLESFDVEYIKYNEYDIKQKDEEYLEESSKIKNKIISLEKRLNNIDEDNFFTDIRILGKNIIKIKNINNEILKIYSNDKHHIIQNDEQIYTKFDTLEKKYFDTLKNLKIKINDYQRDNHLPISKKLLINKLIQDSLVLDNKIKEYQIKQEIKNSIKTGMEQKQIKKHYKKLLLHTAIEHDDKFGYYDNDEIILDVIEKAIESELWEITTHALNEFDQRQSNSKIKEKISNFKKLIFEEIENIDQLESHEDVFLLTSGPSKLEKKSDKNRHEITNKGLLKDIIKSKLKNTSDGLKNTLADIKESQQSEISQILRNNEKSNGNGNGNAANNAADNAGNAANNAADNAGDAANNAGGKVGKALGKGK